MSKHVLIVEDDVDISRLLRLELEDAGYRVSCFDTGMRGLAAIREERPDLVILDLGLPDLSGAEIARRLRRTRRAISAPDRSGRPRSRITRSGRSSRIAAKPRMPESKHDTR